MAGSGRSSKGQDQIRPGRGSRRRRGRGLRPAAGVEGGLASPFLEPLICRGRGASGRRAIGVWS
jgi:hypothetical protein